MRLLLALVPLLVIVAVAPNLPIPRKEKETPPGNAEDRDRSNKSNSTKSDADLSTKTSTWIPPRISSPPPASSLSPSGYEVCEGREEHDREKTLYDTIYFVNDDAEKVIAFYQDKLPEAVRDDSPRHRDLHPQG